ncbi:flagellar biosynthetic protein FliQ [Thermanaeromonas toyohensis ToBE]|uniref:Flagellar biosynthetic protein FliQ n=1 Tax=Thermanaeromonas toyohensis ToBE TaxID=698762 RepID=A0A1W1VLF7_9FIRM|nr:flagellar biosynthesis protein FliQ [Thermanaeromonas toyohensis]SMB94050.1 flagellar biosynthetic protein FliQ [Thermanaeromonas toyohensis ToBE]
MTQEFVLGLAREALTTALLLAAPALLLSLVVGVGISIFQAATQIQEQTLTFVPKIVAVVLAILLLGRFMLGVLLQFTSQLLGNLGSFVR